MLSAQQKEAPQVVFPQVSRISKPSLAMKSVVTSTNALLLSEGQLVLDLDVCGIAGRFVLNRAELEEVVVPIALQLLEEAAHKR